MSEKKQLIDTITIAIDAALSNIHTATIARVNAVGAKTITVQPVINRVVDGKSLVLTEFTEVIPLFMQGGASHTTYPITVGDYCLLILTERCFDRWYEGQDFQSPAEFRMHDYSDGIAIVGLNPRAGALTIPAVIQQTGDTNQDGNYTHQGNNTQTGNYDLTGDILQTGNITQTGDFGQTGNTTVSGLVTAGNITTTGNIEAATISVGGQSGVSGTFTTVDSKTVTVVNGLITSIV